MLDEHALIDEKDEGNFFALTGSMIGRMMAGMMTCVLDMRMFE